MNFQSYAEGMNKQIRFSWILLFIQIETFSKNNDSLIFKIKTKNIIIHISKITCSWQVIRNYNKCGVTKIFFLYNGIKVSSLITIAFCSLRSTFVGFTKVAQHSFINALDTLVLTWIWNYAKTTLVWHLLSFCKF